MDKTKFTAQPQLDSEGFLDTTARCRGCAPEDQCPRSGHCERYDSPLRFIKVSFPEFDAAVMVTADEPRHQSPLATFDGEAGTYSDVKCNTCSPWSLLDQDHLDRIHQIWVNSAERYRQQLADWYYEAQTEAKL